ncbi:MAG: hypothetical protein AB3X41_06600 [Leptothrix ochracea]|uniref:hypothetical protein n=1 Tax=Leptothrix ochracea TaxID=735331 RepID=UPI0034E20F9C
MPRCVAHLAGWTLLFLALLQAPVHAQDLVQRSFPAQSLRGELQVVQPPDVLINGNPARLSPGARIHGLQNMLVMSGALVGPKFIVNYSVDALAQLSEVWLLRPDEAQRPWPTTPAEAAALVFDPVAQVWLKP